MSFLGTGASIKTIPGLSKFYRPIPPLLLNYAS